MDEQEWLVSVDPGAMLTTLTGDTSDGQPIPFHGGMGVSVRQLKLWVAAMAAASAHTYLGGWYDKWAAEEPILLEPELRPIDEARMWCDPEVDEVGDPSMAVRADLLREIRGNPFRPVTLPASTDPCKRCRGKGVHAPGAGAGAVGRLPSVVSCRRCKGRGFRSHQWLTPAVLTLADAAYNEQKRECKLCREGFARIGFPNRKGFGLPGCPDCKGNGTVDNGTLDPERLGVLADALEEAGCVPSCKEECQRCKPSQSDKLVGIVIPWSPCGHCADSRLVWGLHPVVAHLRSPGPHVRGCHVLDLIRNKV